MKKLSRCCEAAVRANPNDDNLPDSVGAHSMHLGKYEAATPYLRSYLERNPKDQQAWYLLGKTYLQLSEDALGKINQIDPNSVTAHIVAGEIDESMHNYDGALEEYKKAADLAPQQPGTHEHMGNTFWVTGRESAETEFKASSKKSQQLHGEMEAGECHPRSKWFCGRRIALHLSTDLVGFHLRENPAFMRLATIGRRPQRNQAQ